MQIGIWGLVRSPSSSLAGPDAAAVRPGLPGLRLFSLSRLRFRLWGLGFRVFFRVFRVVRVFRVFRFLGFLGCLGCLECLGFRG